VRVMPLAAWAAGKIETRATSPRDSKQCILQVAEIKPDRSWGAGCVALFTYLVLCLRRSKTKAQREPGGWWIIVGKYTSTGQAIVVHRQQPLERESSVQNPRS
jgi:hypothetical protein